VVTATVAASASPPRSQFQFAMMLATGERPYAREDAVTANPMAASEKN
jgi:hypothetical protein